MPTTEPSTATPSSRKPSSQAPTFSPTPRPSSAVCPVGSYEYESNCYTIFPASIFVNAVDNCKNADSTIVDIATDSENDLVSIFLSDFGIINAWIGFTDESSIGEWLWVTGLQVTFTKPFYFEPFFHF
jgi:hypothetical protein